MRGNENDVSIVEFVEKICGAELLQPQKDMLMKLQETKAPLYLCFPKQQGRLEALQICREFYKILYGPDIKRRKLWQL